MQFCLEAMRDEASRFGEVAAHSRRSGIFLLVLAHFPFLVHGAARVAQLIAISVAFLVTLLTLARRDEPGS